ncbi:MAG: helix-turn-helix domain-containing protein [Clostridia bacterium]|nr:helix-turn-helix domain-containing protein [Clostridia bacterium]
MTFDTFSHFCTTFYQSTFTPIHYFVNEELVLQLPEHELYYSLIQNKVSLLVQSEKAVTYLETREFNHIGIVKSMTANQHVIIGPVLNGRFSKIMLKNILIDAALPPHQLENIYDLFNLFPVMDYTQFMHILILINYELNGEFINLNQIIGADDSSMTYPIDQQQAETVYTIKEEQNFHNTYQLERKLMKIIEDGQPEEMQKYIENPTLIKSGMLSDNNLRSIKNIFIVAVTLATRAAIKGGLDIEAAYNLSDTYIRQMERLAAIDAIYQLQLAMMVDFSRRVSSQKIPEGISSDIYECIQYISRNTNRSLSVSDIAAHVNKNRSYLSTKFKAETRINISEFIMNRKLEEARNLLSFTDKSISDISYYFCFSSQSYFQNMFKKKYGITPNDYRNQSKH